MIAWREVSGGTDGLGCSGSRAVKSARKVFYIYIYVNKALMADFKVKAGGE